MTDTRFQDEPETIFIPPDIRTQTIENAQAFIEQKRVKRLIMYQKLKQDRAEKATKMQGREQERYQKRADMVEKSLLRVAEAIEKAEKQLAQLQDVHNTVTNIETEIKSVDTTL